MPAYSTLDRQIGHLRTQAHQQLYQQTLTQLSSIQRAQLDILLVVPDQERSSPFNRLKESPGAPTLTNLRLWEKRMVWLNTLLNSEPFLKEIAHTEMKQFAREASQLELGDMHDIKNRGKRYLLLLCLLQEAKTSTYDQLTTMFLRRLRRIHHNAKEKLKQLREEYLAISAQLATALEPIRKFIFQR